MRDANIWTAAAMRPDRQPGAGADAGDDADRLQSDVSGHGRGAVRPEFPWLDGVVPATGRANQASGLLSRGRQCASRPGGPDGGAVGADGGGEPDGGPRFDRIVPHNGYAWWYVDALSSDGKRGITLIAFIGSVFSPYYAFARRRGDADPRDHCALNVAIYEKDRKRWAMTERRRERIARTDNEFVIGPSSITWDGEALTFRIDEITNPVPSRLQGTVRVYPTALTGEGFALDAGGQHRWRPIAPCARVQVDFQQPAVRWLGDGYFDINSGDAPLEQAFSSWQWSRASTRDGTIICYDTCTRERGDCSLALHFGRTGAVEHLASLSPTRLPATGWRISRTARGDNAQPIIVRRTLEDAPFYARSHLSARLFGKAAEIMHESLSLDRFRMPLVQAMLPFRMPRW